MTLLAILFQTLVGPNSVSEKQTAGLVFNLKLKVLLKRTSKTNVYKQTGPNIMYLSLFVFKKDRRIQTNKIKIAVIMYINLTQLQGTGKADLVTSIHRYSICCELESFHAGAS